jgi:hypothetical protein
MINHTNHHYHKWIIQQKQHILPSKTKYEKNIVMYDLKCKTMDYLSCMIYMMKQVENER